MPSKKETQGQNEELREQRSIFGEIKDIIRDTKQEFAEWTDELGGAKDYFKQINQSSKLSGDQQKKYNKDLTQTQKFLAGATKGAKKLGGAMKDVANAAASALGEIGAIAAQLLSLSIMGAVTSAFTLAISKFQFAFKSVVNELGTGFDVVNSNVQKSFEAMRSEIILSGLEFKEVIGGALDLSNNFGMAVSEAQKFSFRIADGAKALGVQTKTMSTLVGQFELLSDMSTEQSHQLSEQIGLLAAQNDVAPAAVLEDMAGSTEEMALFSKGGVKNFAKTAIEARKLGMSVKDVANSLKGMLNFEDSLNKEMQASVMLGKNINLNEARRLTFAGDTAGAFQAIANELGDVDLGALDPLTLQSVADAAGMSTEQLMKMSKGADEMGGIDMGEEALSAQETAALKAENTLTEMEKVLAKSNELAMKMADILGPSLVNGLGKIIGYLEDGLPTLEEWSKKFSSWWNNLEGFSWMSMGKTIGKALLDGLVFILKAAGGLLLGMGKALGDSFIGGFLKAMGVGQLLFPKVFSKAFGKVTKTLRNIKATWLKFVVKPFKNFTRPFRKMVKRFTGSKGFGLMKKVMKGFGKAIKFVTKPIRFLLKPFTAVFKVAKALFKPITMFAKAFGKIGLKGIPILGWILTAVDGLFGGFSNVDKSLTGVTGAFKNMYRFVTGFVFGAVEGIVTAFTGLFDYIFGTDITSWFKKAFDFIENGWNTVTDGLIDFFTDIPGKIAALFSNLGTLILDSVKAAGDLGMLIIDWVTSAFSNLGELIMGAISIGATFFSDLFSSAIEGAKAIPGLIADGFMGMGTLVYDSVKSGFGKVGEFFSGIGKSIADMFPTIDFGAIATDMTSGAKAALSGIKDLFTWPINKMISAFNSIKNTISNREIYGGKTLMEKGSLIGPGDWGYSVVGDIPWGDIAIPKITTPNLGADFTPLHRGGTIKSDGTFEGKKGEVYAGAGDQAFKPISEKQETTNRLLMEQNRLLMRIIGEGIPVTKGV